MDVERALTQAGCKQVTYGGCNLHRSNTVVLWDRACVCRGLRPLESEAKAMIENILLLALAIALMVYLVYALLRPEKF